MLDSRPMHRSPVTKENLISNPVCPIEAIKKATQILRSTTKIDRFLPPPIELITDVEIYFQHRMAICAQSRSQAGKKRRTYALQKQKLAFQLSSSVSRQLEIIHEHSGQTDG
jgi:hypothetical protein